MDNMIVKQLLSFVHASSILSPENIGFHSTPFVDILSEEGSRILAFHAIKRTTAAHPK